MDFNTVLENNLSKTINRYTYRRFSNDLRILNWLNKDAGLSLQCISLYTNKTPSCFAHYQSGLNSISENTIYSLRKLMQYVLTMLEQKIEKSKDDLTLKTYNDLKSLHNNGVSILNPYMKNKKTQQARNNKQPFKSTT